MRSRGECWVLEVVYDQRWTGASERDHLQTVRPPQVADEAIRDFISLTSVLPRRLFVAPCTLGLFVGNPLTF